MIGGGKINFPEDTALFRLEAGGKLSTWFSPGELVELFDHKIYV